MEEKNKIDIVINALDQAERARPSEAFLVRMENMALAYSSKLNAYSRQTLVGIASACLLLFAANIYAVNNYQSQDTTTNQSSAESSYILVPTKLLY